MNQDRLPCSDGTWISYHHVAFVGRELIQLNFAVLAVITRDGNIGQWVLIDEQLVGISQGQVAVAQRGIGNDVVAARRRFAVTVGIVVGENTQYFFVAQDGIIWQIILTNSVAYFDLDGV